MNRPSRSRVLNTVNTVLQLLTAGAMEIIDGHGQVAAARADVSYADVEDASPTKAGHVASIIDAIQNSPSVPDGQAGSGSGSGSGLRKGANSANSANSAKSTFSRASRPDSDLVLALVGRPCGTSLTERSLGTHHGSPWAT